MSRRRSLALGIVISALFLWLAMKDLDWSAVQVTLQRARWAYLVPVFVIWTLGLATRAMRWRVLMGGQPDLIPTYHILNIGFLVNNTLPFRVGELARAFLIGRGDSTVSGFAALSSIVAERILDMLFVVLMLVGVLPFLTVDASVITGGVILGIVALLGFGVLVTFAHHREWAQTILRLLLRLLPFLSRFKLESVADRLLDGLQPLTTRRGLSGAVLWTAVSWALSVIGAWALALVFPDLPPTTSIQAALTLCVVAASFSIIIPFTIASVGPFEAASVFALLTASVAQELAVAYAVVWHAGVVLLYAVWGVVGLLSLGTSLGQIQRGAASFSQQMPSKPSD